MTPRRGQMVGRMGVKSRFNSDLHQIWWEGAFLQVTNRSFIRLLIFLFWAPHLTPRRVKWGAQWGSKVNVALILTKLGGKEPFCKLLKDLSWYSWFFYFESPIWPQEGVRGVYWGSEFSWAPIPTKSGGKEPFLQLIRHLPLDWKCIAQIHRGQKF